MSRPVPVQSLLASLSERQVRVWIDDGRIRCAGPATALTSDVAETIRNRKADILAFFADEDDGAAIRAGNDRSPPLSFAQQRLWFIDRMLPDAALHHMSFAVDAHGLLDLSALKQALEQVVERHAVLRTRVGETDGEPVQTIVDDALVPLTIFPEKLDGDALAGRVLQEAHKPFDLALEPPFRLAVAPINTDHNVLVLTLHHICADGWSIEVFLRDFAAFYQAAVTGRAADMKPLPIQYGDFAAWQRQHLQGDALSRSLTFWKNHLSDLPNTQLPTDFQRPAVRGNAGGLQAIEIDAETTGRLRAIAASEGATLFATLFAAFNILVHRYTGQADLVIGTPVANRRHRETEDLIGLFVNPLPIRTHLRPAAGFAENLRAVRDALWAAQEHQDLPFERLVEELKPERDPSFNPLFQLKFQLDAEARQRMSLPGLELHRRARQEGVAKLDLSLDLTEAGDIIRGHFEYDIALFRPETIRAMARHLRVLVEALAENPAQAIAALPLLSLAERQLHLVDWNQTAKDFDPGLAFHVMFEARVAEDPDGVAVIHAHGDGADTLTYDALNRRANRLAHLLRRRGVGPETVVGIALERGIDMVAAWLAVLKAGGAYLPLDPAYPAERLAYMLSDSDAALVISHSAMALPAEAERIDLDCTSLDEYADDNPAHVTRADHLAYVIYTSGSTGRPKGVLVQHGGLTNLTDDKIRTCDVRPGDCVLQFFSFSFDASIPELVMSLGSGARLLMLSADAVIPGPELARQIERHGVTHVTMTPSALLALPAGDYPALRMVLVGGEAPSPELIARWSAGGRRFINAYGPTETTVNASMVGCGNGAPLDATLWPAANKQLHVLDENLEILPVGVPGELHIGGVGLARGYHGRPALTAERFVPDPFGGSGLLYRTGDRACRLADGRIRILGRLDEQVKIRGYRIEPGEIEAAMLAHPQVASAAIAIRSVDEDKRVIAYAVASAANKPSPAEMRAWLGERLPRFLVPSAFIWLDALPLTVNGKIDMAALPDPNQADAAPDGKRGRQARGATEEALCKAFRTVLNLPQVLASDDFFELGGHSLLATKLVSLARERFGLDIGVLDIFNAPSVEGLAARIDSRGDETEADDEAAMIAADIRLDPSIRPSMPITPEFPPRRVLLTGATGFLGAYLLHGLLRDPGREVWCLVRGEHGGDRVLDALARYGLLDQEMMARVHPVRGDLSAIGLGLDASSHVALAASMDAVVHNGAEVHHLHPYERLRAANVRGMEEVLLLACAGRGRPFHHISSLSALTPRDDGRPIREADGISGFAPPAGGYNTTKWVAEHLAEEARSRGLPVSIYRPGAVTGDSKTGAFNSADILCRLMQGYLRSAMAPEGDAPLEMLPVDHVARNIVHLIDKPSALGGTYHMVHSAPASSSLIFEAAALEGIAMQRVGRDEWRENVRRIVREEPDHPLYALAGLFDRPSPQGSRTAGHQRGRSFDCTLTRAALADITFAEPSLDASLFRTYVQAFIRAGALQTPISDRQHHD